MNPWTRAEKRAWDAGFIAAESRIPKTCNPHKANDRALADAWARSYDAALQTQTEGGHHDSPKPPPPPIKGVFNRHPCPGTTPPVNRPCRFSGALAEWEKSIASRRARQ